MAGKPVTIKYPLDRSGVNPNNLIMGEIHDLNTSTVRAVVPNYGPYFTESLVITDVTTGKVLVPHDQYKAIELYQDATSITGKEICAAIAITDTTVGDQVELKYQTLGGPYVYSADGLLQMIEALDLDDRPVKWGDIYLKPSAFPPAPHLHDIGDLYGFEYLVVALEQVRYAILVGDEASHDELRAYFKSVEEEMTARMDSHENDFTNPHRVTQTQVGLSEVQNYGISSEILAREGVVNNKYMTPLRTAQAVDEQALKPLNTHLKDFTNPHRVTKAQVGLGEVQNYPMATVEEASLAGGQVEGTTNKKLMSPYLTAKAIETHSKGIDHPYATTEARGFVQLANKVDHLNGSGQTKVMNPVDYAASLDLELGIFSKVNDQIVEMIERLATKPMVGKFNWHLASSLDSRDLEARGQLVKRADYQMAWEYIQKHGRVVSDGVWSSNKGCFSSGNGSTTFRMPDLRDRYLRVSAGGSDTGKLLGQMILSHSHSAKTGSAGSHGHSGKTSTHSGHSHSGTASKGGRHGHSGQAKSAGSHRHAYGLTTKYEGSGALNPDDSETGRNHSGYTDYAGSHTHTVVINDGGEHSHGVNIQNGGAHDHSLTIYSAGSHDHNVTVNSSGGSENRPETVIMVLAMYAGPY